MTNAKPMTILRKLTPALLLTLCALMPPLPAMAEEADDETEVKGLDFCEACYLRVPGRESMK